MSIKAYIRAAKNDFKRQRGKVSPPTLEKIRQSLDEQREVERERQENTNQPRQSNVKEVVMRQLALGGRRAHAEFEARSREFRRDNSLPSGVLGSDIPGLKEEQDAKTKRLEEGTDSDT